MCFFVLPSWVFLLGVLCHACAKELPREACCLIRELNDKRDFFLISFIYYFALLDLVHVSITRFSPNALQDIVLCGDYLH